MKITPNCHKEFEKVFGKYINIVTYGYCRNYLSELFNTLRLSKIYKKESYYFIEVIMIDGVDSITLIEGDKFTIRVDS